MDGFQNKLKLIKLLNNVTESFHYYTINSIARLSLKEGTKLQLFYIANIISIKKNGYNYLHDQSRLSIHLFVIKTIDCDNSKTGIF